MEFKLGDFPVQRLIQYDLDSHGLVLETLDSHRGLLMCQWAGDGRWIAEASSLGIVNV